MKNKQLYLSPDCEFLDICQKGIICESMETDELPDLVF